MPDLSGLYPQPPQQNQGLLTGNPMQTIGALGELQRIGITAQQAPALGQIPGQELSNLQLANQNQQLQLQDSARQVFLNAVVNGLPQNIDKKTGQPIPPTSDDVLNTVTNVSRFYPQAVAMGAGGATIDQLTSPGPNGAVDVPGNVRAAQASILGAQAAASRVQGPVSDQGQPTQQSLAQATSASGPIPTGLGPAQSGLMQASQQQYSSDQATASNYKNAAVSLENVLPLLQQMGPNGTGLTFDIRKKLAEAGVAVGADDSTAKVMEEVHKYLLRGVLTTGDTATNDKMWQSISSNPNESLVTGANIDLARVNLAQMRLKQAQVMEAARPTPSPTNPSPAAPGAAGYSTWAPQFNTSQDARAYVMDQYNPKERQAILTQVNADRNSNDPTRQASAQQFLNSYRIARAHPGLMNMTKLGNQNGGQ